MLQHAGDAQEMVPVRRFNGHRGPVTLDHRGRAAQHLDIHAFGVDLDQAYAVCADMVGQQADPHRAGVSQGPVNFGHAEIVVAWRNDAARAWLGAESNLVNLDLILQPVEFDIVPQKACSNRIGFKGDDIAAADAGEIDGVVANIGTCIDNPVARIKQGPERAE
ncbi:hypothetical protein OEG82_20615 [Hoeflea sp. J2-29]|uniref:Uncharacterized protein n=1 Tax=Hoeflea ulvae TaxID=2983764 RepID=A0ABT3YKG5_9HYPH|nr:hypothetical protein [Hoeflea ulvae]MCY0096394.1 hypothetical protein [Hoeflea ulvae]